MMKTSLKGQIEIIAHEAIVLQPYLDSKGIWTIGIGHTAAAGGLDPLDYRGKSLTIEQALALFARDLAKFEKRVNAAFTRPLSQAQFDAAVSFDFNTGKIDKATWVKTFNAGNVDLAAKQIMNWSKPASIIDRRKKEQSLFRDGTYSSNGMAMTYPASAKGAVLWGQGKRVNVAALLGAGSGQNEKPIIQPVAPAPDYVPDLPSPPKLKEKTMSILSIIFGNRRGWAMLLGLFSSVTGGAMLTNYGIAIDADTLVATIDLPKVFASLAVISGGLSGVLAGRSLFAPKGNHSK